MASAELHSIAIIADAHLHDIDSDYDFSGITIDDRKLTLRSWVDTRRSSRVFNESKAALVYALHDIEQRGIKHVVLLGDYSDDGQIESIECVVKLLNAHRDQYGTQFFAITGNHDAYGPQGKHQSTRFVDSVKGTTLVTSNPKLAATEPDTAILTHKMYCDSVADSVEKMAEFGFFNSPEYLHWETPFGTDDNLQHRRYNAISADGQQNHLLVDASYLVEPVAGLWLLMLDANVFEPCNGQWLLHQKKAFMDSSDAGWNSVLRQKPHLVTWIKTVCSRAVDEGKTLLAFSHYPVIDPLAHTCDAALKLFGDHEMCKRKPEPAVADELLDCGLQIHFSGHLHIDAHSIRNSGTRSLIDCMVPSLVSFPASYKIAHSDASKHSVETIHIGSLPLDPALIQYYRQENRNNKDKLPAALEATSFGEFLYHRMHTRVINHYLLREWPQEIAQAVTITSVADLLVFLLLSAKQPDNACKLTPASSTDIITVLKPALAQHAHCRGPINGPINDLRIEQISDLPMTQLISDWYCLRFAHATAKSYIPTERMAIYRYLSEHFADLTPTHAKSHHAFFALFIGLLGNTR